MENKNFSGPRINDSRPSEKPVKENPNPTPPKRPEPLDRPKSPDKADKTMGSISLLKNKVK